MIRLAAVSLVALALPLAARSAPLCEKYLLEGKLAEGEKALTKHLADKPGDDEARMGLAAIQLGRAVEGVTQALYRHGLRSADLLRVMGLEVRAPKGLAPHPKPQKLTHDGFRKIIQKWVDDLGQVDATLVKIKSDTVKLPLPVARIKLDLFGNGQRYSAVELLGVRPQPGQGGAGDGETLKKLVIAFDRGDAHWLCGYCHFLCAVGELVLALDTKELFDSTAHLFFIGAETPYAWLKEDAEGLAGELGKGRIPSTRFIVDAVSFLSQSLHLPVKEPARMKDVLKHLEGMVAQGKTMWKHILAETDDDREWIPNPKQTGVLGVPVNKERVENWLATLDEVEAILKGKKLVPFWRGKQARGLNLRSVFLNPPKKLEVIRWVQGTAAAPYLEKGTITALADPKTIERLDRVFGGVNFFGFAFWFN